MDRKTVISAPRGYTRILACAHCQQRKVKCDRNTPCGACIKAGVAASCVPNSPAPVRMRRRPVQDLGRRLARCEELLLQHANVEQSTPSPAPEPVTDNDSANSSSGGGPMNVASLKRACLVIQNESSTRVMDSHLWAALYDELRDMRAIVEAEDAQIPDDQDGMAESDADLLLSGVDPLTDVADLQPDPTHTFRLWQLFLDRVNPLTKVIHVPTMQPIVLEATAGIQHLPLHHQALLFSIYILAIVSLSAEECTTTFGMTRDDALRRYTLGARVALNRFNFLKNENMAILQALVLFLYSLPGRYDRYATWIVSGIVVRIAQKMGYHLDGEALGLRPFETEMRRRIWWQIVIRDATHTAVSGVSPSLLPADWDTKEPQNLNDADLFPNATEFPRPREGLTEMAFCLILHRAHKLIAEIQSDTGGRRALEAALLGRTLDGKNTAGEIQWTLAKFRGLSASVDAELRNLEVKYLDAQAGPAHTAARSLRASLARSLTTVLTPIEEQAEFGTEILTPEDNVFKLLVIGHEHNRDTFDMMAELKFGWWMSLDFQAEGLAALTGQLCQRPTGSLSDRGWKVLDRTYTQHPELLDTAVKKHRVQGRYVLKAWEARSAALVQAGQDLETPQFVCQLQSALGGSGSESASVPSVETLETVETGLSSWSLGFEQQEFSPQVQEQVQGLDPLLGGFDLISWGDWGNVLVGADQFQFSGQGPGVPH